MPPLSYISCISRSRTPFPLKNPRLSPDPRKTRNTHPAFEY